VKLKQLHEILAAMTPEELEKQAVIFVPGMDRYFGVKVAYAGTAADLEDAPDHVIPGQPIITLN